MMMMMVLVMIINEAAADDDDDDDDEASRPTAPGSRLSLQEQHPPFEDIGALL